MFCYPEMTSKELNSTLRLVYRNLSDVLLESLKGWGMSSNQIKDRFVICNPEILDHYFENGQNAIILTQHVGNWEWGGYSIASQLRHTCYTLYKPLSNKWLDKFMLAQRGKYGIQMIPSLTKVRTKKKPSVYIFLNDQYPANMKRVSKVKFFNHDTGFNRSPVDLAVAKKWPLFTMQLIRVKRGHYTLELKELKDRTSVETLLQSYVNELETNVELQKDLWLWSHRRFKDQINY